MLSRDHRTLVFFGVGTTITIAMTLIAFGNWGNLFDKDKVPFVSLYVGLISFFITTFLAMYDRFASFEEATRQSTDSAFARIESRIREQKVGSFIVFDNTNDALSYEFRLLDKAKRVWNTRFRQDIDYHTIDTSHNPRDKQDEMVAKAMLKNDCHYELIVSVDQSDEITKFLNLARGMLQTDKTRDTPSSGEYSAWTLDTHSLPLIQMFIIETTDGAREALVGWIHSDKRILRPCVVVFRDVDLVRFYLNVFEIYKDNAVKSNVLRGRSQIPPQPLLPAESTIR